MFKIVLHHKASARMADHHWPGRQTVGYRRDAVDTIGQGARRDRPGHRDVIIAAKVNRQRAAAAGCEEIQEMLVPAPRAVRSPVNEEKRNGMRVGDRPLVDYFEHGTPVPSIAVFPSILSGCKPAADQIRLIMMCHQAAK